MKKKPKSKLTVKMLDNAINSIKEDGEWYIIIDPKTYMQIQKWLEADKKRKVKK